jgi:hypothetical protein
MAAYNKFQDFVQQLLTAVHDFTAAGHVIKIYLSNTAPSASLDAVKADLAEIGSGNGYTAGGEDTQNTMAESGGVATVTCTKVVWTASGGTIGPFQYVVAYNDTSASDNLISWWDYGSAITLQIGETFTVKFNNGDPTGTLLTCE